jgi:acyl carrier protein
MDIRQDIERFIVEDLMLADSNTKLDPDSSLLDRGVLDSLSLLRLINFIEERLGVTVEDDEVLPENFQTLNVTVAFVEGKL